MLPEDGNEETTLIIIMWVEPHATFEVERVAQLRAALLIVVVGVVLVKHSLTEGVRLTLLPLPFWH